MEQQHKTAPHDLSIFNGGDTNEFFKRNFITFKVYSSPSINYFATSTQKALRPGEFRDEYSFFYPKNSIREETSHNYGTLEGTLVELIKKVKQTEAEIAKAITVGQNLLSTNSSRGILQEEPTYFLNTSKRKFDITIDLYYISDIQKDIYNPISFFKKYSHALKLSENVNLTQIQFPHTFRITGGVFDNPALRPVADNRSHLVLLNMTTEYNPDIQLLNEQGYPAQARLTLSFEEVQSLFSDDWGGKPFKESISEKGGGTYSKGKLPSNFLDQLPNRGK